MNLTSKSIGASLGTVAAAFGIWQGMWNPIAAYRKDVADQLTAETKAQSDYEAKEALKFAHMYEVLNNLQISVRLLASDNKQKAALIHELLAARTAEYGSYDQMLRGHSVMADRAMEPTAKKAEKVEKKEKQPPE